LSRRHEYEELAEEVERGRMRRHLAEGDEMEDEYIPDRGAPSLCLQLASLLQGAGCQSPCPMIDVV